MLLLPSCVSLPVPTPPARLVFGCGDGAPPVLPSLCRTSKAVEWGSKLTGQLGGPPAGHVLCRPPAVGAEGGHRLDVTASRAGFHQNFIYGHGNVNFMEVLHVTKQTFYFLFNRSQM